MNQPIKRKRNINITMQVNEHKEAFIQAQPYPKIQCRMKVDETSAVNQNLMEEDVRIRGNQTYVLADLENHRVSCSRQDLVQLYWLSSISMGMTIFDAILMLIVQICITWMPKYSFIRVFPQFLLLPIMFHMLYCFWIYQVEKRKERFDIQS